jgi:polyisoprenoid-binding protein YceI
MHIRPSTEETTIMRIWLRQTRRRFAATILTLLFAISIGSSAATAAPQRYTLDPSHLSIGFMVMHIGFAKTLGIFKEAKGSFVFDADKPAVSEIDVVINAASVFTNHAARDDHLRNADFLYAEKFPEITFRGTSAAPTGPRTGTVTGDLTLRGVTRPVTLNVTWNRSGAYPFGDKHEAIGISARTTIKRSEFGMTYALAGDLVGDDVEIILEFEAIRQGS